MFGMECIKCGRKLIKRQQKYCSYHCSKLYLKNLYRLRKREQINAYNRAYRKLNRPAPDRTIRRLLSAFPCLICGTRTDTQVHHLKHQRYGADQTDNNLVVLCRDHHVAWHKHFPNKRMFE